MTPINLFKKDDRIESKESVNVVCISDTGYDSAQASATMVGPRAIILILISSGR